MMRDAHLKLNPLLPWHKQHTKEEDSFQQQIRCIFKEETSKMHILSKLCMVLQHGYLGK